MRKRNRAPQEKMPDEEFSRRILFYGHLANLCAYGCIAGAVLGVLAGILILGVINNGLVMLKVDDNMTNIVKGLIIVGSVILDMRKNAKRA